MDTGGFGGDLVELQERIGQLEKENMGLKDKFAQLQHLKKKEILEVRTELDYERKKASDIENRWKELLKDKQEVAGYRQMSTQLANQLSQKENELQQLRKLKFQLKKRISELQVQTEKASPALQRLKSASKTQQSQLQEEIANLRIEKSKIQQAAVSAIMEKDGVITELQETIRMLKQSTQVSAASQLFDLKEKLAQMQENIEKTSREHEQQLYYKNEEIAQLKERLEVVKARSEERLSRLEHDISEYEVYIERLKEEKVHEDNLAENYDVLQEKNRKQEKLIQDLEVSLAEEKMNSQDQVRRLEHEVQGLKSKIQVLKVYQTNFSALEKEVEKSKKTKEKETHDLKQTIEQLNQAKSEAINKNMELEAQNKRMVENIQVLKIQISDTLAEKQNYLDKYNDLSENFGLRLQQQKEIMIVGEQYLFKQPNGSTNETSGQPEGLKTEPEEDFSPDFKFKRDTLDQEIKKTQLINSRRRIHEDGAAVQTMKRQIDQLQQRIKELEEQISEKTAEVQTQRDKILKMSEEQASNKQAQKLNLQVETLKIHLQKIENNLLIVKLKSAEDESFWRDRQIADRKEFELREVRFIKEKTQLYEKLQKLRKTKGQPRTDYYQTSLR